MLNVECFPESATPCFAAAFKLVVSIPHLPILADNGAFYGPLTRAMEDHPANRRAVADEKLRLGMNAPVTRPVVRLRLQLYVLN